VNEINDQGIIVRTVPYTESSLIVHWITHDSGRLATIAKGARRPKSSFRGRLDLFYLCDLRIRLSRRSTLHTLREASVCRPHTELRQDLNRLTRASYAAGLIERIAESDTPIPELYDLLEDYLADLCILDRSAPSVLLFECKLLATLGLMPSPGNTALAPGTQRIVEQILLRDWGNLTCLSLSTSQETELHHWLNILLTNQLGYPPKHRSAALESDQPTVRS